MSQIAMPKLSDSMEEGTIVSWLVEDGDDVTVGTAIAEIETDKATMAFEAESAGVVRRLVAEGELVQVGAPIAELLVPGESPSWRADEPDVTVAVATDDEGSSSPGHAASVAEATDITAPAGRRGTNGRGRHSGRVPASPVARRIAQTLGIDLAALQGTGPDGRVVKRDVLAVAAEHPAAAGDGVAAVAPERAAATIVDTKPTESEATHVPKPQPAKGEVTIVEPTRVQLTIGRRMAQAKASMPEFTLTTDVDMDAAIVFRGQLKEVDPDAAPSVNDLVVRACALALRAHPGANGAFVDGHFELYERINVGIAVASPGALLVPTIFDADRISLGAIARESKRLAAAARDGSLTPAELSGGTFSVSNLGMFGIASFTAVLNPPQAAILAVGALEQRAIARNGELTLGHRMTITLTCDHRILYGADAATFLAAIRDYLHAPLRLAL